MATKIIYHNDADGFCAAYLFSKAEGFAGVEFIPAQYGDTLPEVTCNDDVYILDFSYKREMLIELASKVHNLVLLDHHKTAQKDLEGIDGIDITFDMNHSGCQLAWDYLHPSEPRPKLVDYIGDRDLWKFELPYSRELNLYIHSYEFDFKIYGMLEVEFDLNLVECMNRGISIRHYQEQQVKRALSNRRLSNVGITIVDGESRPLLSAIVNSPILQSEIGEELCKLEGVDFAVIWYQHSEGYYIYSLRSRGEIDVSKIAKGFGGGGHKNAAGFSSPMTAKEIF